MSKPKTFQEVVIEEHTIKTIREIEMKHYYIIEYLLNKNSHPILSGEKRGVDYKQFFEDMEDFAKSLID